MEIVLALLVPFAAFLFFAILVIGIAQGHGRSTLEDAAQYEHFNPPAQKVDGKTPISKQTTDTSETLAKSSEKAGASSQGLSETTYVRSVMQRQPYYCFEDQSVDEVRTIMRELHLRYLVVLDHNMRVVGTVKMEDLNRRKQDPPAPDSPEAGKWL